MATHALLLSLVDDARAGSLFPESEDHGVDHWRGVADQALFLADGFRVSRAERVAAFVFGAVHDCRRVNDGWDPEHGERAAEWLAQSGWIDRLEIRPYAEDLLGSLTYHDKGQTTTGFAAGFVRAVGWDADRSLLHRVGITPNVAYFSLATRPSLFRTFIERSHKVVRSPADWDILAQRALDA